MIIWKKKSINLKLHKLIKAFNKLIKQCYHIVWGVKKTHKVKIQKLERQKTEK